MMGMFRVDYLASITIMNSAVALVCCPSPVATSVDGYLEVALLVGHFWKASARVSEVEPSHTRVLGLRQVVELSVPRGCNHWRASIPVISIPARQEEANHARSVPDQEAQHFASTVMNEEAFLAGRLVVFTCDSLMREEDAIRVARLG